MIRALAAALAVIGTVGTAQATSTPVFFDSFWADTQGGGGFVTVTSLTNWDVIQGNVDLLNDGGLCGAEACIDLDGSNSPAPSQLESKSSFSFLAGQTYELELAFMGGLQADGIVFGIVGGASFQVGAGSYGFTDKLSLTVAGGKGFSGKLFIQMTDTPNTFGPWLNTVTLTQAPVPLPAGAWLMLGGLGGLALLRRRQRTQG